MFVFFNCIIAAFFLLITVFLPFRFARHASRLVARAQDTVLARASQATFDAEMNGTLILRARILGGFSAGLFLILAFADGALFRNVPDAVWRVFGCGAVSLAAGGLILTTLTALSSFIPKAQGYALLSRHGFKGLWTIEMKQPSRQAKEALARRIQTSSKVGIVDVTGFELLGKGPGPAGGLLHDALEALPDLPVQVLLLKPDARVLDPEEILATIFQSLLAEMEVSSNTYMKRIQATLNAVAALNEARAEGCKIEVRFFSEKPMVRAIVLDDSVLVSPWHPKENLIPLPVLEIGRETKNPTFYEAFRRHFARLWGTAAVRGDGSKVDKRQASHLQITTA